MHSENNRPDFVVENIHRLADFRKAQGITQIKLAEMLNISAATINGYENYTYPRQEMYNRLAEIFGWQKWKEE